MPSTQPRRADRHLSFTDIETAYTLSPFPPSYSCSPPPSPPYLSPSPKCSLSPPFSPPPLPSLPPPPPTHPQPTLPPTPFHTSRSPSPPSPPFPHFLLLILPTPPPPPPPPYPPSPPTAPPPPTPPRPPPCPYSASPTSPTTSLMPAPVRSSPPSTLPFTSPLYPSPRQLRSKQPSVVGNRTIWRGSLGATSGVVRDAWQATAGPSRATEGDFVLRHVRTGDLGAGPPRSPASAPCNGEAWTDDVERPGCGWTPHRRIRARRRRRGGGAGRHRHQPGGRVAAVDHAADPQVRRGRAGCWRAPAPDVLDPAGTWEPFRLKDMWRRSTWSGHRRRAAIRSRRRDARRPSQQPADAADEIRRPRCGVDEAGPCSARPAAHADGRAAGQDAPVAQLRRALSDDFTDGVFLVHARANPRPRLVAPRIASAVGVGGIGTAVARFAGRLAARQERSCWCSTTSSRWCRQHRSPPTCCGIATGIKIVVTSGRPAKVWRAGISRGGGPGCRAHRIRAKPSGARANGDDRESSDRRPVRERAGWAVRLFIEKQKKKK